MITPWTRVRFQCARQKAMSYRAGSRSVMLVWPQRSVRRYQGSEAAPRVVVELSAAEPASAAGLARMAVAAAVCFKNARRVACMNIQVSAAHLTLSPQEMEQQRAWRPEGGRPRCRFSRP